MTVKQVIDDTETIEAIASRIVEKLRDEGVIGDEDELVDHAQSTAEEAVRDALEEIPEEMP
jgi:hypothetical protein